MKDVSIPFEERAKKFIYEREMQYKSLIESDMHYPPDLLEMLDEDISEVEAMEGLPDEEIAKRCDDIIDECRLQRGRFLREIS